MGQSCLVWTGEWAGSGEGWPRRQNIVKCLVAGKLDTVSRCEQCYQGLSLNPRGWYQWWKWNEYQAYYASCSRI